MIKRRRFLWGLAQLILVGPVFPVGFLTRPLGGEEEFAINNVIIRYLGRSNNQDINAEFYNFHVWYLNRGSVCAIKHINEALINLISESMLEEFLRGELSPYIEDINRFYKENVHAGN